VTSRKRLPLVSAVTSRRRLLLASAVLVVTVVVATVAGLAIRQHLRYGAILDQRTTSVTVQTGDRFSLRVPDRGPSVGDNWQASVQPEGVVVLVGDELVPDSLRDRWFGAAPGGGRGSTYVSFDAEHPGQVTVTLTNCWRGCLNERTRAGSTTIVWTVTVS
jgi:hypothetical protein